MLTWPQQGPSRLCILVLRMIQVSQTEYTAMRELDQGNTAFVPDASQEDLHSASMAASYLILPNKNPASSWSASERGHRDKSASSGNQTGEI